VGPDGLGHPFHELIIWTYRDDLPPISPSAKWQNLPAIGAVRARPGREQASLSSSIESLRGRRGRCLRRGRSGARRRHHIRRWGWGGSGSRGRRGIIEYLERRGRGSRIGRRRGRRLRRRSRCQSVPYALRNRVWDARCNRRAVGGSHAFFHSFQEWAVGGFCVIYGAGCVESGTEHRRKRRLLRIGPGVTGNSRSSPAMAARADASLLNRRLLP
jgi:hypothetical protein